MRNIIASYVKGTEQMPWEWKVHVTASHETFISKCGYWYMQGGCSDTICLFWTHFSKNSIVHKSTSSEFSMWGVWFAAAKLTAVSVVFFSPWMLPLHHPHPEGWTLLRIQREKQILAHIRPPLRVRVGFLPPEEKLQHKAVRSSEKNEVCI